MVSLSVVDKSKSETKLLIDPHAWKVSTEPGAVALASRISKDEEAIVKSIVNADNETEASITISEDAKKFLFGNEFILNPLVVIVVIEHYIGMVILFDFTI